MLIYPSEEIKRSRLISDDYRKQQQKLHENPQYGVASQFYAPIVAKVINQHGVEELLDYGAGKGRLMKTISEQRLVQRPLRVQHYDPAIPEWAAEPDPAEMVACIDVLEHIEPHLIDNVLDHLLALTKSIGLFTIATSEAEKTLPDGRNAHLIVQPSSWWLPRLQSRWELHVFQKTPDGFFVLVMPHEIEDPEWRSTRMAA